MNRNETSTRRPRYDDYPVSGIDQAAFLLAYYERAHVGIADHTIIVALDLTDPDCRHWCESLFPEIELPYWQGYPVEIRPFPGRPVYETITGYKRWQQ